MNRIEMLEDAATTAGAKAMVKATNCVGKLMTKRAGKTWIPRLGALLVVVGGIQLGIGFKDDDQTGKTRGMQCMIGGAIVAAIGASVSF